jgi:hypothetical protein
MVKIVNDVSKDCGVMFKVRQFLKDIGPLGPEDEGTTVPQKSVNNCQLTDERKPWTQLELWYSLR